MSRYELLHGDCLEKLKGLADNSVDAVVTDPPYELAFMGRKWDASGIAYNVDLWRDVMRVLKPGGHLLAFGGTRTYHRMACAIEDAGFEIRDSIHWMYGSGFPKSLDVSKAMDKAGGIDTTEFKKWLREKVASSGLGRGELDERCGFTMRFDTPYENDPVGWGVSLPTPEKWQTIKQVLSIEDNTWDALLERVWRGRAGEEVSENSSMSGGNFKRTDKGAPVFDNAKQWQGWGTALKPSHEPIVVARKPLTGTVAANVLEWGTGALNIDGCRVGTNAGWSYPNGRGGSGWHGRESLSRNLDEPLSASAGRWPPNTVFSHLPECGEAECAEGCAVRELDRQSGVRTSGVPGVRRKPHETSSMSGRLGLTGEQETGYGDSGGASRFFPVFRYQAKASRRERDEGLEGMELRSPTVESAHSTVCLKCNRQRVNVSGACQCANPEWGRVTQRPVANTHPTVKPVDLCRWLVRLVTPPNGLVLDPFTGSGTTGVAALLEGFRFVGCEREDEYYAIAKARLDHALSAQDSKQDKQRTLFDLEAP